MPEPSPPIILKPPPAAQLPGPPRRKGPPAVTRDKFAEVMARQSGLELPKALELTDKLEEAGLLVLGAPPARQILADAQTFAERTIIAELVVRLFHFFVLGSIVLPDTPAVMDWLKSYIEGGGHGPLGAGPLRWPIMCPSAINVLTRWGYEPTKSTPAYVIKTRQG